MKEPLTTKINPPKVQSKYRDFLALFNLFTYYSGFSNLFNLYIAVVNLNYMCKP